MLVVKADAGTTTRLASMAHRAVLAKAGTTTRFALVAPRAMLAKAGAAANPTLVASRVMLTVAGAAAIPALVAPLVVRTLLPNEPFDWMWCRGFRRYCRSCWDCLFHGAAAASACREVWLVAF